MRKYLIVAILILCCGLVKAQTKDTIAKKEEEVYSAVEQSAEFPGGFEALANYLSKSTGESKIAKQAGFQGAVRVSFIVEKDGSLTDIKLAKSVSPEMDAEVIRIIKAMPKWNPATQKNIAVRQMYSIPVKFQDQ